MVHDFKLPDDKKMTFRTFSSCSVVKNKSDFKLLQFEAILFQLDQRQKESYVTTYKKLITWTKQEALISKCREYLRFHRPVIKVMSILHRRAFLPTWKPCRIRLLFTHKNGNFGAISVTERKSLKWTVTHQIGVHAIPDSFCATTKTMPERASIHT